MRMAVEISRRCPPSPSAFSVGAVLVDRSAGLAADASARVLATGYSRELDPRDHAEEVALRRLAQHAQDGPPVPAGSLTLYSSLEPCSARASRPRTCTELIIEAGIRRVVFAWREPEVFVDCEGAEIMRRAGLDVVEVPSLAAAVRAVNAHLLA
ncbi:MULTISPECIES: dCMP deaminase [Protofrankia]|uniref:dCMP deaminase n=1 Tax=Protofrankia TaxID=2994361 RepID=UPI0005BC9C84|nr:MULTISPECIES: dCMP deaminase [Protofrankia]